MKIRILIISKRMLLASLLCTAILFVNAGLYIHRHLIISSFKEDSFSKKTIIIIDPGHGGIDTGTKTKDFIEKEINLSVGKKIQRNLNDLRVKSILTREGDYSLEQMSLKEGSRHIRDLEGRLSIIRKEEGSLLLSVHINSEPRDPQVTGAIVYYYERDAESQKLAETIQNHLNCVMKQYHLQEHKPRQGDYYLLREGEIPGVIVELGFITNQRERELLKKEEYQVEIAKAIVSGIKEHIMEDEKTEAIDIPVIISDEQ
ncbi:N-acetylmuramoyl-L-alanine amidase family protein [Geosporobacter ferrireducens]|uniref:MurNAc-LAA domain-containing protein n=1 Tax=Geosporobacter ferrireducens TaxID=1424294 RepID=A0A1D8GJK0_9FIRM|nr:N-acetylmuramoyl-L-alanine amidase [Geosporobacter ferrireducens]AOT71096.1 hypothetical protein Gferi_16985 [Geosporobacter ferrireducens]